MRYLIDSLPGNLRSWFNGLQSLTLREIEDSEKRWQLSLLEDYADGILTREEANSAWATWQQMKLEEIKYLDKD
jgi:hypothetical protein